MTGGKGAGKMALSPGTWEEGLDLGVHLESSQLQAFAQMVSLSGIPSPPGNMPPVLQRPTSLAPYPCDGSLAILIK